MPKWPNCLPGLAKSTLAWMGDLSVKVVSLKSDLVPMVHWLRLPVTCSPEARHEVVCVCRRTFVLLVSFRFPRRRPLHRPVGRAGSHAGTAQGGMGRAEGPDP